MPVAALRRLLLPGLCGNIRVCPHRRLRAGVPALRGRMWRAPGRSNVAGPGPLYPGPAQGGSEQAAATAHTGRFGRTPSGRRRRAAGTRRDVAAAILRGGEGLQEGLLAHVPPTPSGPPAGPAGACPRLRWRRPQPAKGLDRSAPLQNGRRVRECRPRQPSAAAPLHGVAVPRFEPPSAAPKLRSLRLAPGHPPQPSSARPRVSRPKLVPTRPLRRRPLRRPTAGSVTSQRSFRRWGSRPPRPSTSPRRPTPLASRSAPAPAPSPRANQGTRKTCRALVFSSPPRLTHKLPRTESAAHLALQPVHDFCCCWESFLAVRRNHLPPLTSLHPVAEEAAASMTWTNTLGWLMGTSPTE